MRLVLLIIFSTVIARCNQPTSNQKENSRFEVEIFPAFSEPSILQFQKKGDTPILKLLIRHYNWADNIQDTFYYKRIVITGSTLGYFDSLNNNWPKLKTSNTTAVLDGIHWTFARYNNQDTSKFEFHSPSLSTDSIGYHMTSSLITMIDNNFRDALISDYLIEVRAYSENDPAILNAPRRLLFDRRQIKYGWEYRR